MCKMSKGPLFLFKIQERKLKKVQITAQCNEYIEYYQDFFSRSRLKLGVDILRNNDHYEQSA